MDAETKQTLKHQGAWYVIVGLSSALIELVLFQSLYSFTPLPVEPSNVIAVIVATTYNFTLNRRITFEGTSNPLRSLVLYLLLFAFNTTFSTTVISLLVSAGWHSLPSKIFTMFCIVLWNFVLYRKVIFK